MESSRTVSLRGYVVFILGEHSDMKKTKHVNPSHLYVDNRHTL